MQIKTLPVNIYTYIRAQITHTQANAHMYTYTHKADR